MNEPTWKQIGKLYLIAIIKILGTYYFLIIIQNYFHVDAILFGIALIIWRVMEKS